MLGRRDRVDGGILGFSVRFKGTVRQSGLYAAKWLKSTLAVQV